MAIGERKEVAETKKADGTIVPAVPAAPAIAASAKRLYGYGASNPNQILNDDKIKNLDKGGDPIKQTQVSDSPNATAAQKTQNPVAEGIKPAVGTTAISGFVNPTLTGLTDAELGKALQLKALQEKVNNARNTR